MASHIERRKFLAALGGAAALPLAARAQQPAEPVIGFLSDQNPLGPNGPLIAAFRAGLAEARYVEGRNVKVEYRWGRREEERLKTLAADLVGLRVAVIVAFGSAAPAFAAKKATSTIPIVIAGGTDPVTYGLVGIRAAADALGLQVIVLEASRDGEIEA